MRTQIEDPLPPRRRSAATKLILAMLLASGLAACGGSSQVPQAALTADKPDGVYIIQDGRLGRLDEDPQKVVKTWDQRTNLKQDVQFLVIDESVATAPPDANRISLQKVALVRNEVSKAGKVHKAAKTEWVVANVPSYTLPVTVTRHDSNPRVLLVTANEPLEPGLYSLTYRGAKQRVGGRFGVGWGGIDKTQYASRYCVDRYLTKPAMYRPCAERDDLENAALKVNGLQVHKQIIAGKPALVLEGRLTNTSTKQQKVPVLLAVINDKNGRELSRWTFQPKVTQLRPGATLSFRTGTTTPPKGTAGVAVLLLTDEAAVQKAQAFEQSFLQDTELPTP
jgi:Protein of unknown function (DUF3426)